MRPFSCIMITATLGLLLTADQALAVRGVKSLHFSAAKTICEPDQAYPCDPQAGLGESNTIQVHQSLVGGQWVFDSLEVPGLANNKMWLAANYGAECKVGYGIDQAWIRTGWFDDEGKGSQAVMVHPDWTQASVPHSGQKKLSTHVVDVQMPLQPAFDAGLFMHFPTRNDVLDYAENVIATRIAEGQTEEEARAKSFEFDTWLAVHGYVRCKGHVFGREGWKARAAWLPMKFVFVGVGAVSEALAPVDLDPPTDELTVGAHVTQAFLFVAPDANDSCRLRLTGAFRTNAETDISYRFVDELGHASQLFTTTVDASFVSMIDHYVELPEVEHDDGEIDQLVNEELQGFGEELVGNPTDREQGFYQIQVLEPHGYWSNVADFNVEPCQPQWQIADGLLPEEQQIVGGTFPENQQIAEGRFPLEWEIAEGALPQVGREAFRRTGR